MTVSGDADSSGDKDKSTPKLLVRKVVNETIQSLGGPISKTIMWHMSNRGVFSESTRIDMKAFYLNLKELIGPGADMIMDETWKRLKKQYQDEDKLLESGTSLDMIMKVISLEGGMR